MGWGVGGAQASPMSANSALGGREAEQGTMEAESNVDWGSTGGKMTIIWPPPIGMR